MSHPATSACVNGTCPVCTARARALPVVPRNPDRIDGLLRLVGEIWRKNPDLRLTQLILNVHPGAPHPVYGMEDDVLRDALKATYGVPGEKKDLP